MNPTEIRLARALGSAVDGLYENRFQQILAASASPAAPAVPVAPAAPVAPAVPAVSAGRARRHDPGLHRAALAACCVLALLAAAALPLLGQKSGASGGAKASATGAASQSAGAPAGTGGGVANGPCMFAYYLYDGRYYALGTVEPSIQKRIVRKLSDEFYQIQGEDPAQCIAMIVGGYYWKLTYAFDETVTFRGVSYLLDPDSLVESGKPLGAARGSAGALEAFEATGQEVSREIAVKYRPAGDASICPAYAAPVSVYYQGKTYWINPQEMENGDSGAEGAYLGKPGGYPAYRDAAENAGDTILLRLSDTQEVRATADASLPAGQGIPESLYGTVRGSIQAVSQTVHWQGRGVYLLVQSSFQTEAALEKSARLAGRYLGTASGCAIYEIKGRKTSDALLVKNNRAFIEYDFIFADTLVFEGRTYSISDGGTVDGKEAVCGGLLGFASNYGVYAVKGVSPQKAVFAQMGGWVDSEDSIDCTELLIRK